MSYFRQIRKNPDNTTLVKELSERLSRSEAEKGIEDVSLLRQMRVDTDRIAYTDTPATALDGDLNDTDTIAYTDSSINSIIAKGAFVFEDSTGDNLEGFYKFDNTATDSSGNGFDLTVTNDSGYVPPATLGTHAKTFDGSTEYAQAASNTIHDITTGDFSVAGWFRRTDTAANARLVSKKADTGTSAGYMIYATSNRLRAIIADSSTSVLAADPSTIPLDTWFHLVVVYDRDGVITIYVDGVSDTTSASIAGIGSATNTQTFTVGRDSSGSASFAPYDIDDLRFYKVALSSTQVSNIYNGYSRYGLAGVVGFSDVS